MLVPEGAEWPPSPGTVSLDLTGASWKGRPAARVPLLPLNWAPSGRGGFMCLKTTKARWTRHCHPGQKSTIEAIINRRKLQQKSSVKSGVGGKELFLKSYYYTYEVTRSHVHPQGRTSTQKRPKNRGVTSEELKAKAELSAARLGTCPGTESGCQDLDSICSLFHFFFFFLAYHVIQNIQFSTENCKTSREQ